MQLLNDGAPAHRARATTAYMNANNVNVVDFLPKSPDLNIVENIWDELNHRARRTGATPTTLNQPRANIFYEWNNLPQNYVQCYVTSMRHRSEQCGGHTCHEVHMDMDAAAGFHLRIL